MTTHSSILAWRIPWTEEPGRLQSMGSQRINTTGAAEHTDIHTVVVRELVAHPDPSYVAFCVLDVMGRGSSVRVQHWTAPWCTFL